MKLFFTIIVLFIGLYFFSGCQKNVEGLITTTTQLNTDTVWQTNISSNAPVVGLQSDIKLAVFADSFTYNNTLNVSTASNFTLSIPSNSLANSFGTFTNGIIRKQTQLLQKKGDFIAMNLPTTCNGKLLVTEAAFYINLKNEDKELMVAAQKQIAIQLASANATTQKIFNAVFVNGKAIGLKLLIPLLII